jgi:hypothetical protein
MAIRTLIWGLGALGGGLAALLGAKSISTAEPHHAAASGPVATATTARLPACTASGAKHLRPPISDAQACTRFMVVLGARLRAGAVQSVTLRFLPQGVASAGITHGTGGQVRQDTFELAVSDRPLVTQDIDKLAADAVAGLARLTQ